MSSPKKWVMLGKIYREWGLRGHVTVHAYHSQSELFPKLKKIYLKEGETFRLLEPKEIKRHGKFWLLKLKDCETPEAAQLFRGKELALPREDLPKPKKGELYISDLEGLKVQSHEGKDLGVIEKFLRVGDNEIMVIRLSDKNEAMIPYHPEFVELTSVEKGMVVLKKAAEELL